MIRLIRWIWWELTRPRGKVRHRYYRVGRSSRGGVALLMAISSIMLLTLIVTEIAHSATIRVRLAANHRDEVRAEALAKTGIQLYRLLLMASKHIGRNPLIQQYGQMFGFNGDSLWQAVPKFNSMLLRMIFVSGGDLEDEFGEGQPMLTDDQRDESREGSLLRRNFLDFDGDFEASVKDESEHIYVGNLQANSFADLLQKDQVQQLQAMMLREEVNQFLYEENLDRMELIGNLVDWTDADNTRIYEGGYEDAVYQKLDPPYLPKNAPFDTRDEIRLVEGWHLDGVWQRLGRHLTIYGDGKVNVNTAHRPVMHALLTAYADGYYGEAYIDEVLAELMERRGRPLGDMGVHFSNAGHFKAYVEQHLPRPLPLKQEITNAVTTEATVFRVLSTGTVGSARVEIVCVMDFSRDPTGKVAYWRIR